MTDVVLEYPEDVDLILDHGHLTGFEILDAGWAKLVAAGWPSKGEKAIPMNITVQQDEFLNLTVTVWATKN